METRARAIASCIVLLICLAGYSYVCWFLYYSPDSPRNKEARNRSLAEAHIPAVRLVLQKDPRFTDIRLVAYTGQGGCLGVFGRVASRRALAELRAAIEGTAPPAPVYWEVRIEDGP